MKCLILILFTTILISSCSNEGIYEEDYINELEAKNSQSEISSESFQNKISDSVFEYTSANRTFSNDDENQSDPASGLPSGKRQHKPFTIIKITNN